MSIQNKRSLLHIGSAALIILALADIIANMTPNAVIGQEDGNVTATPSVVDATTPESSQDDSPTQMATITICVENLETGKVTCEKTMEPVPEEFRFPSALSGASNSGTPSISLSLGKTSLVVGETTRLTMTGQNLLTGSGYTLKARRSSFSARTGFGKCQTQFYTISE